MYIFDLTNLGTLILVLSGTILFIFLSQEIKNSKVAAIPLFVFLIDLVIHTIQVLTIKEEFAYLHDTLCINMAIDFGLLIITLLAYLWADEVEAKAFNKKTLNGKGISWLWKKV